jgi:hypothetical protein
MTAAKHLLFLVENEQKTLGWEGTFQAPYGGPITHSYFQRERSSSSSTLNGYLAQVAKRKAPSAAEKTEKFRGALTPNASVIAIPNNTNRIPLDRAVMRVYHPTKRQSPSKVSAPVVGLARVGITAGGKNQLSFAVYATNRAKLPQATLG